MKEGKAYQSPLSLLVGNNSAIRIGDKLYCTTCKKDIAKLKNKRLHFKKHAN